MTTQNSAPKSLLKLVMLVPLILKFFNKVMIVAKYELHFFKKHLVYFCILLVIVAFLIVVTWIFILGMVFLYLMTFQLSAISALAIILLLNFLFLFVSILFLKKYQKKLAFNLRSFIRG